MLPDGHKRRRRVRLSMMIRVDAMPFEPPRAPAWARPGGSFRDDFGRRGAVFRRRGPFRARFRGEIRAAVGRRVSPPPRPEKRRRRGAKPAQTARGRGGAARRGRARQARAGARAGGTGLFGVPRRSAVPATLFAPSASRRSRPTCSRRSIRERRRSSPLRWGRRLRAVGPPRSSRPRPQRR